MTRSTSTDAEYRLMLAVLVGMAGLGAACGLVPGLEWWLNLAAALAVLALPVGWWAHGERRFRRRWAQIRQMESAAAAEDTEFGAPIAAGPVETAGGVR